MSLLTYAIHYTEGLTKNFGNFTAVNGISFDVNEGEIFGLLGPNGAGKTTTIRMLCTILTPTSGKAEIKGFDVVKQADEVRRKIGVVTEKLVAYSRLNAVENLNKFGRLYDVEPQMLKRRIEDLLQLVELWEFRKAQIGTYSSGMRQRLNIVRALRCLTEMITKPYVQKTELGELHLFHLVLEVFVHDEG